MVFFLNNLYNDILLFLSFAFYLFMLSDTSYLYICWSGEIYSILYSIDKTCIIVFVGTVSYICCFIFSVYFFWWFGYFSMCYSFYLISIIISCLCIGHITIFITWYPHFISNACV